MAFHKAHLDLTAKPGRNKTDGITVFSRKGRPISALPTSSPGRSHALTWSAILLLAAAQFAAFVDRAAPAVMAPLIKARFGFSDTQIGALQGPAFSVLYACGLLLAGHMIAGRNPWRVAALCVGVWTIGGAVFALAPNYAGMVAGRILLGLGQAAFAPAALMLLTAQAGAGRRSRSLATFTTGSAIGGSGAMLIGGAALAAVAGQTLAGLEPWRAASLVLVAPNLILIVLLLAAGRSALPARTGPRAGLGETFRLIGRQRGTLVPLMAAGAVSVLAVQAVGVWGASILNRSFDLTAADAALAAGTALLIAGPAGHLGAGWSLGSRQGRGAGAGRLMAAGMVVAALAAAGLAASGTAAWAVAALTVAKIGCGFAAVVVLIELQTVIGPDLRPQVLTVYLALASFVGVGMGPLLTGVISDQGPAGPATLSWALAGVTAAAAFVVVGLGLTFSGRWRQLGLLSAERASAGETAV